MGSEATQDGIDEARLWHLATTKSDEQLVSFELALMQAMESFVRYVVAGSHLVGTREISFNEMIILHIVRMQDRAKDAATIAKLINRDDLSNVLYNLRKLVSVGLVEKVRSGANSFFQVTEQGRLETERYASLRRETLLASVTALDALDPQLEITTGTLRIMTGLFDSALRETQLINPAAMLASPPEDQTS